MNYVWLLCLKWDYWKLHFFVSMVFPFSGLETRSSLQKTTTPHQHNAKKLQDEAEAHQELLHFQNAYPSDPRAFFSTRRARQVGTSVLQRLRTKFPSREREWVMWVASVYCTGVQKRVRKKKVWIVFMLSMLLVVFFWTLKIHRSAPSRNKEKWENCRAKSWKLSRSFGLMWPPFELAKEREIRTDPSWTTFWFFGFYKIPNYLELRLLQWFSGDRINPVGWCPRLTEKC